MRKAWLLILVVLVGCGGSAFEREEWLGFKRASARLGSFITQHDIREFKRHCASENISPGAVRNEGEAQGCWDRYILLLAERIAIVDSYLKEAEENRKESCKKALKSYHRALQPLRLATRLDSESEGLALLDEARDQLDPYLGPQSQLEHPKPFLGKSLEKCKPTGS